MILFLRKEDIESESAKIPKWVQKMGKTCRKEDTRL